jgi:hypothetical protein
MDHHSLANDPATPIHVEFALSHVIAHSRVQNANAVRRLNGIENTVAALAVEWREWRPIIPSRELRMSETTREALMAWVTAGEEGVQDVAARLAEYSRIGVVDDSVFKGWVRLLLAVRSGQA